MTNKYKFSHPTPIQSTVVPLLWSKRNVLASSETGSGKTLAYIIPMIHNSFLNKLKGGDMPHKGLVILPTKELAKQIFNEALIFSKYYTRGEINVKYLTKGMLNSVQTNFEGFLNNNDIMARNIFLFYILINK
jgi:superfamily II DNA/RNA helicase